MKLILLEDVKSVGKKGDIVNKNDGYALNYLIPKKLAVEATKANMNDLELKKKAEEKRKKEELEEAKKIAEQLNDKGCKGKRKGRRKRKGIRIRNKQGNCRCTCKADRNGYR